MQKNIDKSKIIKSILSIICLMLIVGTIFILIKDSISEKNSLTITATIKEIDYSNSHNIFVVEYKVNDEYYKNNIKLNKAQDLTVNDEIDIKVDQQDPNKIINSHLLISAIVFALSLITLAICGPESFKFYKSLKNIKTLKTSGLSLNVPITEVVTNNNARSKKGLLPSYLRCNYLNPVDNVTYTFESEESYQNIKDIINRYNVKTVTVYLDRANTKNYYVDLDSLNNQINLIDPIEFMKNKSNETPIQNISPDNKSSQEINQEASKLENKEEVKVATTKNIVPTQTSNLNSQPPSTSSKSEIVQTKEINKSNEIKESVSNVVTPLQSQSNIIKEIENKQSLTNSEPKILKTTSPKVVEKKLEQTSAIQKSQTPQQSTNKETVVQKSLRDSSPKPASISSKTIVTKGEINGEGPKPITGSPNPSVKLQKPTNNKPVVPPKLAETKQVVDNYTEAVTNTKVKKDETNRE